MKKALTGIALLLVIVSPAKINAVTLTPLSWYQINNAFAGGGTDWMPNSLEVWREGNFIRGSFWNFELADSGGLISANIDFELVQYSLDLETRLVFFEGATNWPSDPTPSFFEYEINFNEYNTDHSYKTTSFDITQGLQAAINGGHNSLTIGIEPKFPGTSSYHAYFKPLSTSIEISTAPVPIPEPSTLLITGLSLFIASRCRKKLKGIKN